MGIGGSGVSGGGSNVDLDAIVEGGQSFLDRIKQLQDAQATVQASFVALNLGRSAAEAYADAQKNQQAAKDAVASANKTALNVIVEAEAKAADLIKAAQDSATQVQAQSDLNLAAFNRDLESGRRTLTEWSNQTTDAANALLTSAQAKSAEADKMTVANQQLADQLTQAKAVLEDQIAAAKAAEDAFNAKLNAIKAAAGSQ